MAQTRAKEKIDLFSTNKLGKIRIGMECSNARHAYLSFTNGSSAGFLECRTPGRADRYLNFQCKLVERDWLNVFIIQKYDFSIKIRGF